MKGQFEHMMKLQEKCKELKSSIIGGGDSESVPKKGKGSLDDREKTLDDIKDKLLQSEKNKEIL